MVIIGGVGSILGSFLGAAFIVLLPIFLNMLPHMRCGLRSRLRLRTWS